MMPSIRHWVEAEFASQDPKLIIEAGSHKGEDTAWLSAIPGVTMHCFEPDPRNTQRPRPNVTVHRKAIAAYDGTCPLILSTGRTASSSIRKPLAHLEVWPEVSFGTTISVECVTLDTFTNDHGIVDIAFQWWDIQGAEVDAIRGGTATLALTRYLYTEYCPINPPWYKGQIGLDDILKMLPAWRIIHQWPNDVLLRNMAAP